MPELRLERAVRTLPIDGDLDVTVASLQAKVRWDSAHAGGGFGMGVSTPLAVQRGSRLPAPIPWTARSAAGMVTAMICGGAAAPPREENDMDEPERIGTVVPQVSRGEEIAKALTSAGTGQGVVGPATTAGDRTVVPLIETTFSGGYGGGGGREGAKEDLGAGGGGGGFGRSRTVAVVDIGPDGVRVQPVFDKTAVILAGIAAAVGLAGALRRGRGGR